MKSPVISASSPCEAIRTLTVTGGMPQGPDEAHLVADPLIGLDEIDEPGLPHRRHRVGEHRRHVRAVMPAGPMREFDAAHQVMRLREGRDQRPSTSIVFQPT